MAASEGSRLRDKGRRRRTGPKQMETLRQGTGVDAGGCMCKFGALGASYVGWGGWGSTVIGPLDREALGTRAYTLYKPSAAGCPTPEKANSCRVH